MPSLRQIALTTALAAVCALLPMSQLSAADLLTVKSASVGFGGKFKAGFWQPVRVTLVAGSAVRGRLEILATDGDQMPVIYANEQLPELNLAAGQEASFWLYAKSGPI